MVKTKSGCKNGGSCEKKNFATVRILFYFFIILFLRDKEFFFEIYYYMCVCIYIYIYKRKTFFLKYIILYI